MATSSANPFVTGMGTGARGCPYARALVQLRDRRMHAAPDDNVTLLALKLRVNELLAPGCAHSTHGRKDER